MDGDAIRATKSLVSQYSHLALQSFESRRKKILSLINHKKCPEDGWTEEEIEVFLHEVSMMDSNNFLGSCGVGERESRFASRIVARRHFYMGHGIGRSGDITEIQPKAAGSSLMAQLTNHIVLDLMKHLGVASLKKCIVIPLATGMSVMLCLRTLHNRKPDAKYVIWTRVDQKSCFKCIIAAGLTPIIIKNELIHPGLIGSVAEIETQIGNLGCDKIVCVLSTTSSFVPKVPDNIVEIGKLCKKYDIPHIVNNAYGIQCLDYLKAIESASKARLDVFISSTDKNFMVPVGGSIICGFDKTLMEDIGKTYPGRASATPTTDLFITLLTVGKNGYLKYLHDRENVFDYLKTELLKVSSESGGDVLDIPGNRLSVAYQFSQFKGLGKNIFTEIGSMLFSRFVIGARLIAPGDTKAICGHEFINWGAHTDEEFIGYLTASATIGIEIKDVDIFIRHLRQILIKLSKHINPKMMCDMWNDSTS